MVLYKGIYPILWGIEMATEKFKALVHFMVHECVNNPGRLGAVRLNKALWFTDVISYKSNGTSVTGEKYVKRQRGPVPARILSTLEELVAEDKIIIREPEFQYDSRKFLALARPDPSVLSESERDLAATVLETVCGHSANDISELSHDIIWESAAEGEEIPLYATLAADKGEISEDVRLWADGITETMLNTELS